MSHKHSSEYRQRPLLVLAVTSAISMDFFKGQIVYLQKAGFDIAVVCSPGWANHEGVTYYPLAMEREISIWKDIRSLYLLVRLFQKIKPSLVNAGTPKAGLLVSIAAFICRVPVRIYTCHGLRLETLTGWKRILLTVTERITAFCANRILCVSKSLKSKFIEHKLATADKITVLGEGSCNGIDLSIFNNMNSLSLDKTAFCKENNIREDARFIGFIGRLTKDKGIYELIEAFAVLKDKHPNLYLLLLGEFEDGDPISENTRQKIVQDERIIHVGYVTDTIPYYKLMELLILPTYREGLPTVLLEAGAMGIPVVATRATGCVDVVVDGVTGLLVPVGNSSALAKAVELLLHDKKLAVQMGQAARQRVTELYNQDTVWKNMREFYQDMLAAVELGTGRRVELLIKRMFDLVVSSSLLVILSPVFLVVAAIIVSQMGFPVFFKQTRPGLHAKPFNIYKFRTMTDERDEAGNLLPDEKRLTKSGAMLRKFSLDELPQLMNVLKGELSLVGPRPLLMEYLPLYTAEQARRHEVKPGITGWAQINGRNSLKWEDKFRLDVWYVDNWSIWLDVKILWLTVLKVISTDGIHQQGHVTMEKYRGSEQWQDY